MSHPFGDLVSQHLHRKHGLSQAKLAEGILQDPSIIGKMCKGDRLHGPQARERVCAIIAWLCQQAVLTTVDEANGLFSAAGMAALRMTEPTEAQLLQQLHGHAPAPTLPTLPPVPVTPKPHTNLPAALTSFVGRGAAIAEVAQHVANSRLVTLTGAGGVGKTRLALEVGKTLLAAGAPPATNPKAKIADPGRHNPKFPDGVWFVDLAPLTDPEAIPQRILDLWRVPEQFTATPLMTLTTYLSAKQTLLIVDNCEHLIDACATLAETLLQHCPQLSLLATSREALNIGGETPWRVPSLTRPRTGSSWDGQAALAQSPATPDALLRFEAVALFIERARVRQPSFALTPANAPAVAHICTRLDGIPLALEMAAARINIFTVEELAQRLDGVFDGRFQLLTNGVRTAPLRHQTLRATLEWSYGLLTAKEQGLLVCLSVFSGGWSFAAAQEVTGCSLDQLAQLVNKSLVIADQHAGQTRYRLLETVRQFSAEQFGADGQKQRQVQWRHSHYYLRLLGEQEAPLQSPKQRTALDMLRADFANISTAWHWAVEQHEFALLDPAIQALFLYSYVRSMYREGRILFTDAATKLGELLIASFADGLRPAYAQTLLQPLWARMLLRVGACEEMIGNHQRGEQALQQALPHIIQDRERIFALEYLGMAAGHQGKLSLARTYLDESLALSQHCNDWAGMASALHKLIVGRSDYAEVCRLCAESLALWRKVGRPDRIANVTVDLGWYTWCVGDYAAASLYLHEGLALCQQLDLLNKKAWALNTLGYLAWSRKEIAAAERLHLEALSIYADLGLQIGVATCKADLSLVLVEVGRVAEAITLAQDAVATMLVLNNQMMLTVSLNWLSVAHFAAGDLAQARDTLAEVVQQAWEHRYLFGLMIAFYHIAEWLVAERHVDSPNALEYEALGVTLLSFVCSQTATWQFYKDKAARLQAQIKGPLPDDLHTTAIVRGQTATVEEMVATVLGVLAVS